MKKENLGRHKCYTVDLDVHGEGIKGFHRFKSLAKAEAFQKKKGGVLFHEYQSGVCVNEN